MGKGEAERMAALTAKRAGFRLQHVGTKLNQGELRELEALLARRGQRQGEFIRGLILAEIERDRQGVKASAETNKRKAEVARGIAEEHAAQR